MLFINLYVCHSSFICINPVVSHRRKSNVENRILFESKLFSFDGRAAVERNTQCANGGNATEEYGTQTRLGDAIRKNDVNKHKGYLTSSMIPLFLIFMLETTLISNKAESHRKTALLSGRYTTSQNTIGMKSHSSFCVHLNWTKEKPNADVKISSTALQTAFTHQYDQR